jgi:uncharacterized damage-inducible protein DinB
MNNQTIGDVYANNDKIHEKTKEMVSALSDEQSASLPEGENWTMVHLIEHIAIVQDGMMKISAKLLNEAKSADVKSSGEAILSDNFKQKAVEAQQAKFEAPERVAPTGNQTISQSLEKMAETRRALEDLRPLFETVECSNFKFPHPFFGDLTAHEWLTLVGGHEARHQKQIGNILEKL